MLPKLKENKKTSRLHQMLAVWRPDPSFILHLKPARILILYTIILLVRRVLDHALLLPFSSFPPFQYPAEHCTTVR